MKLLLFNFLLFCALLAHFKVTNARSTAPCDPVQQFTCKSSLCIPRAWVCDGGSDCEDEEDEESCHNEFLCPTDYFRCGNGLCLPNTYRCNGEPDCPFGDDEEQCPTTPSVTTTPAPSNWDTCKSGDFVCDGQCMEMNALCNKTMECEDGADEKYCDVLAERFQVSSSSNRVPKPLLMVIGLTNVVLVKMLY